MSQPSFRRSLLVLLAIVSLVGLAIGCDASSTDPADEGDPTPPPTVAPDAGSATPPAPPAASPPPGPMSMDPPQSPPPMPPPPPAPPPREHMRINARCGDPAPEGAPTPPPLPAYSGGVCPTLVPGENTIVSHGVSRRFQLVVPRELREDERLPVFVVWHHWGGEADSIVSNGQVQESADSLRFLGLVPEKRGDLAFDVFGNEIDPAWPYLNTASDARVEEEARFFDDMLACAAASYPIDESCISTAGVSAGALWVAQLMQVRSERLSSALVISGGIGPATSLGFIDARGWTGATRAIPVMMGWGGPSDQCALSFERASTQLEDHLAAGGNFVVECVHNCGHRVPPVDPAAGLQVLYRFALDHPYWLPPGESPYWSNGMPAGTPEWCGLGIGSATMRSGSCEDSSMTCPVPAL